MMTRRRRVAVWVVALLTSLVFSLYGFVKTVPCLIAMVIDVRGGFGVVQALGYQIRHGDLVIGVMLLLLAALIILAAACLTLRKQRRS